MADTKIKITEVQTTDTVSSDARVLITQDNNGTETLYRAPIQDAFPTRASFAIVVEAVNEGHYVANFRLGSRSELYDVLSELPHYEEDWGAITQSGRANGVVSVTMDVYVFGGSFLCMGYIDGYDVEDSEDKFVGFQPVSNLVYVSFERAYYWYTVSLELQGDNDVYIRVDKVKLVTAT